MVVYALMKYVRARYLGFLWSSQLVCPACFLAQSVALFSSYILHRYGWGPIVFIACTGSVTAGPSDSCVSLRAQGNLDLCQGSNSLKAVTLKAVPPSPVQA